MIQANELRIGNLVLDRIGKIIHIDWIERDKVSMRMLIKGSEVHPLTELFEFLKPIPLTNELLIQCGFKQEDKRSWLFKSKIGRFSSSSFCFISGFNGRSVKCKYLHQLQNIYFALTGKELEISL